MHAKTDDAIPSSVVIHMRLGISPIIAYKWSDCNEPEPWILLVHTRLLAVLGPSSDPKVVL